MWARSRHRNYRLEVEGGRPSRISPISSLLCPLASSLLIYFLIYLISSIPYLLSSSEQEEKEREEEEGAREKEGQAGKLSHLFPSKPGPVQSGPVRLHLNGARTSQDAVRT